VHLHICSQENQQKLLPPELHSLTPAGLIKIAIFLIKIKKIDFFDLNRIFLI